MWFLDTFLKESLSPDSKKKGKDLNFRQAEMRLFLKRKCEWWEWLYNIRTVVAIEVFDDGGGGLKEVWDTIQSW